MILRPYQLRASEFLQSRRRAAIHAPAGSGKTVIGAHALSKAVFEGAIVKWLANTREQVDQAVTALTAFNPGVNVDLEVCCVASEPDTRSADFIVTDECHHTPARTWKSCVDAAPPNCRIWGLSATPWSGDPERDALLRSVFTEFHEVSRAELVEAGNLEEGKAFLWDVDPEGAFDDDINAKAEEETKRRVKRFRFVPEDEHRRRAQWQFTQEALRNNGPRNQFAVLKATEEVANGQSVLVLVHAIEHGEELLAGLPDAAMVFSKIGAKKRRDRIGAFREGSLKCLIATSLADEGLDVPVASRLVLVAGGRSAGKLEQRAGRVLRPYAGKTGGIIHDFLDRGARLANAQAWARLRTYESLGYEPEIRSA